MILFIILIIMMIIFIVDANYNHSCMREITSQIQSINNKIQEIEKKDKLI